MLEGHGDNIYRYDNMVKLNFSSCIWQHTDLTALGKHLTGCMSMLRHYPEPTPRSLEQLIAVRESISPEAVMVTNGATEAIYLIAQLYRGSASVIPQPTFNEYADACRLHHHIISYENNDDMTTLPRDRVYWICNPNNPSGNVLMKGFVDYVVRRSPRYTFVLDQSYEAYTAEPLLTAREMTGVTNLIIIHSFGKTYGVPGLRLGYITAHPNIVQLLRTLRQPWGVSTLSLEAGRFLVQHGQPAVTDVKAYLSETERLRSQLRAISGLRVFETKTNYMLCELDKATAPALASHLIHEHGILIRDCSNFYGLSRHFFRVAAQRPEENDILVKAIQDYLHSL